MDLVLEGKYHKSRGFHANDVIETKLAPAGQAFKGLSVRDH